MQSLQTTSRNGTQEEMHGTDSIKRFGRTACLSYGTGSNGNQASRAVFCGTGAWRYLETDSCLSSKEKRLLLFVYQEQRLEAALSPSIRTLLRKKFGYRQTQSLDAMLSELAEHIQQSATFPHEIGLFLGYPVADVLGFIAHHGEDYLLLGYWKVYRNAEQAKQLFSQYDGCRSYLCRQMKQGRSLYQALQVAEKSSNAF